MNLLCATPLALWKLSCWSNQPVLSNIYYFSISPTAIILCTRCCCVCITKNADLINQLKGLYLSVYLCLSLWLLSNILLSYKGLKWICTV